MVSTKHLTMRDGDVLVLIGTMKGLFLARASAARSRWEVGGPYFPGRSVYATAYDGRAGRRRIWVGAVSEHWGPGLSRSDDFGRTWDASGEVAFRFPQDTGATMERIWQICPAPEGQPDTLYCGVAPAALFRSTDAGDSWQLVRGLWDHPHRPRWEPGFGGLCLHTILPDPVDPDRVTVGISTGGVYQTGDGGRSWQARNKGIRAEFMPDKYPEFGQCVHKLVHHASRPQRMFLQNHWGLYRTDNRGEHWRDVARGVPSDFGFAMAMHPHDPGTVYIVPIESDEFRCTPEGKLRVYRTRDAGKSWHPLTRGLPQRNALETVLRDGMDTDPLSPAGVYFGTRSGKVYASRNDGSSWNVLIEGLPPVVCVKAAMVGVGVGVTTPKTGTRTVARKSSGRKASGGKVGSKKTGVRRTVTKKATKKAATKKATKKAATKKVATRKAAKKKVRGKR